MRSVVISVVFIICVLERRNLCPAIMNNQKEKLRHVQILRKLLRPVLQFSRLRNVLKRGERRGRPTARFLRPTPSKLRPLQRRITSRELWCPLLQVINSHSLSS